MLKTISLFSGIGGLDFGFEAAGFETRVALDVDRHSCNAMRLNRPRWEILEEDICHIPSKDLLHKAGLSPGEPDILIGGPPCQPFSKSSYWVRGDALRLDDSRADTLTGYLRILRDTRPRVFLLENVYGLAYEGKDEGLRHVLQGIAEINRQIGTKYSVAWQVINCAEHGVPQLRERVFVIGARDGRTFNFPLATHAKLNVSDNEFRSEREPWRTAWDAIGDLAEPALNESGLSVGGKWGDLLPSVPEGGNYLWHTNRGGGMPLFGWRTRYWSFLLKLSKRLPSWTIQAQPGTAIGPFHWSNRRLSFRELCRLQTFPEGLSINCSRTEVQRMIGNAVPSLIAEILAREIRAQLLDAPQRGRLKLMPPRRDNIPPPQPLRAVPRKYHAYAGTHDPHPGEGKGRKAITRTKANVRPLPSLSERLL